MPPAQANIRVLVRIRPPNNSEIIGGYGRSNVLTVDNAVSEPIDFYSSDDGHSKKKDGATVTVHAMDDFSNSRRRKKGFDTFRSSLGYDNDNENTCGNNNSRVSIGSSTKQYTFDSVHGPRSTQCEVFNSVKGIIDAVASGYNGTIFAYGQTGSGKTHTVFGNSNNETEFGLVQRSLRALFNKITLSQAESVSDKNIDGTPAAMKQTSSVSYKASFYEIFNEKVYDLLTNDSLEKDLKVRENFNSVYVEGLKEVKVHNTIEAEEVLYQGMANRHVSATNMNRTSSRSHAVFVLTVKTSTESSGGVKKVRTSKFTLVDLAGSERQKSTAAWGARLTEASMINKSLTCLGQVINALVDREVGRERHVPVRDSKLTFLLRDTWGGNSTTCLVATVSPSLSSINETISTLNFAQRAKLVKNNAVLNEDTSTNVEAMKAEISMLRSKLKDASQSPVEKLCQSEDRKENSDIFAVINCRARRNDDKIMTLEKALVVEQKKVNALKRKVIEGTMVRKMKDRRIQYLQSKKRNITNDEEVSILREELEVLQRLAEAPSVEAIEWRVEYSKLKENMSQIMDEKYEERAADEYDRDRLEGIVDRLHKEKCALDKKVEEMENFSLETQAEIDSVLLDVDKQEREMLDMKQKLKSTESLLVQSHSKIAEIEADKIKLFSQLGLLEEEKEMMQLEKDELESKSKCLSEEVQLLNSDLEEKQKEVSELDSRSKELKQKLHLEIESLSDSLKKNSQCTQTTELEYKKKLAAASKDNAVLIQRINEAEAEIEKQNHKIHDIDEKAQKIESDRLQVIAEKEMLEKSLEETVCRLDHQRAQFQQEKHVLEQKMHETELTIESLNKKLDSKTKLYAELEDETKIKETENKTKIVDLQTNLRCSEMEKTTLLEKIRELENEGQSSATRASELQEVVNTNKANEQSVRSLYEKCSADLEDSGEKIQDLEQRIEEQRSSYESDIDKLVAEKNEINQLLTEAKKKLETLSSQSKNQEEIISVFEQQVKGLQDEHRQVSEEMAQENLKVKETQKVVMNNLEKENSDLKQAVYDLEEKCSNYDQECCALKTKLGGLSVELDTKSKDIVAENKKHEEYKINMTSKIKFLEEDASRMRQDIIELKKQIKEKDENSIQTNSKQEQHQSTINTLEDKIESLIDENKRSIQAIEAEKKLSIKKLKSDSGSLELSLKLMTQNRNLLESDMKKLTEENSKLSKKILELESAAKDSEEIMSSATRDFENYQKDLRLLKGTVKNLEDEKSFLVDKTNERIRSLETENRLLLEQIREQKDLFNDNKEDRNKLNDKLTFMKREKSALQFELDTAYQSYERVLSQEKQLQELNDELQIENKLLKERVEIIVEQNNFDTEKIRHTSTPAISVTKSKATSSMKKFFPNSVFSPQPQDESQYSNLETKMDGVLQQMSNDSLTIASTTDGNDDSFDESMFLPNAGVDFENSEENEKENEKENFKECDKENQTVKQNSTKTPKKQMSTPSKSTTGKKRSVLSVIKDRNTRRKSHQGGRTSSYKGSWMLFDNQKMFSDKM